MKSRLNRRRGSGPDTIHSSSHGGRVGRTLVAIIVYVRATKSESWVGVLVFWFGIALLTASWLGNITAGIDPNSVRAGANGLVFFSLAIGWAYWMNRARVYLKTSSM
jgi:hypothetical protein